LLKQLDITCVDKTQRIAKFSIPAHRRDLKIAEDLIEEVGRVLGYDNIPSTLPSLTVSPRLKSDSKKSIDQLKFQLTNLGYHEAINYSFVDSQLQQQLEPSDRCETITLKNPISKELNVMRCSLLSHLVIAARYNQNRQQPRGLLFEVGRCFYRKQNEIEQPQRIAGIRWGNHIIPHWRANHTNTDFFIIKADVEAILKNLKLQDYCFQHTTHSAFHPGRSAEIIYQGKAIGLIGELHPKLHKDLDLAHQLSYFELEIDSISVRELPTFQELSKFPSVSRDISLIVDKSVPAADIVASIRECAGEYLVGVQIFDSFCSDRFAAHKKSVAFNLVWQDKQKTLEDVTISELMENVLKFLSERFDTVLRE